MTLRANNSINPNHHEIERPSMGCVHTENPIFMYPIVRPAIAPKFQFLFVLFALLTLSIGSVAHAQETITMVLSQNPIAENGGTTTVTATVPKAQVTPFELRVSISPKDGGELSADTILTFAANATESTGKVTITAVDNDELDGDRQYRGEYCTDLHATTRT